MYKCLFCFLFFTTLSFSQSRTIIGVVADDTNKPLESANVIARHNYNEVKSKFERVNQQFL
ncbi:hypothetical protein SAMN05443669_100833 [Flavobacterium xanthum]|uniref:Uncharacterized protein n=1 Tax=Flavobacterium xanthum TaxID=69322 RepID=A0A1M7B086_9FLAO|nr:hypothetical protein SAMN05443669_100833 [Flavobacterium xanthum]